MQEDARTPISIRPAREDDAEALSRIAVLSKQSNGYDDAFMAACVEELRVTPELLKTHRYWVAERGVACGFVCLEPGPEEGSGELAALYIHPDFHRQGIGRMLWETLRDAAREMGLVSLHLDADPTAEAFYCGLGFVTVGRAPSGSIPGRTLPHMKIDLA